MEKLINNKIIKIELNEDNTIIIFTILNDKSELKKIAYRAVGDCCSSSWFYGITGINNLSGEIVIEVITKEMPEITKREDGYTESFIQSYGYSIKTSKGYCDIEFRNESNGYYGGYIEDTVPSYAGAIFRVINSDTTNLT